MHYLIQRIEQQAVKVERLEAELRRVERGVDPTALQGTHEFIADVDGLMNGCLRGEKIKTIKFYRKLTGVGLRDAKHAVDVAWLAAGAPKFTNQAREAREQIMRNMIEAARQGDAVTTCMCLQALTGQTPDQTAQVVREAFDASDEEHY